MGFVVAMRKYPIVECGEGMASLREAAGEVVRSGVKVEFSTTLQAGKNPRVFFVREGLIGNFKRVAKAIHERGWFLKVEDGYRTPSMQRDLSHSPKHFDAILKKVMWELRGNVPTAEFMFRRFSMLIATRCRVGTHVSGSAIDVSIFERETGKEIDRGGICPEMSERTPMGSPFVTAKQRENRDVARKIFESCGWSAYPYEFWHYSSGDCFSQYLTGSGKPARYGAMVFDVGGDKSVKPLSEEEADRPLEPLEFYQSQIEAALSRLGTVAEVGGGP
jgi:zinc D-Ala-D-Ala dipeptidase